MKTTPLDVCPKGRPARAALAILIALAPACTSTQLGVRVVEGRAVAAFDRIELHGATGLHVQVGAPLGLSVRGPSDRLAELSTEVSNGTLRIRRLAPAPESGALPDFEADVAVSVPTLTGLALLGSGDVRIEGFEGGPLELEAGGSGVVRASGQVDRLAVSLAGSGDLELANLSARQASVRLSGSGRAVVRAHDEADVEVSGSGTVSLHGRPPLTRLVRTGSGTLYQR